MPIGCTICQRDLNVGTPPPACPPARRAGLTLFCAVPTTLGVGLSLVRACKGNEALALVLTVGTNVLAIFLMPLWLKALFSGRSDLDLSVDMAAMFVKLLITVLAPSVAGKVRREMRALLAGHCAMGLGGLGQRVMSQHAGRPRRQRPAWEA